MNNINEEADMLQVYYECRKNSAAALQLYCIRYPARIVPSRRKFSKLEANLRQYGTLKKKRVSLGYSYNENQELDVLLSVQENPKTSIRELARNHNLTYYAVHKILHKNKLFPYKVKLVQHLNENDFEYRIQFCRWFLDNVNNDPNFPTKILWTDESNFSNNGIFKWNTSYPWTEENPRNIRERNFQNRFSVNVWCGMLGNKILGPYFFNGSLTGQRYSDFLRNQLQDYLDELTVNEYVNIIFQQDGAPPHNAQININHLNAMFQNNWIGTRGPIHWPARSPDITPLDFFLWGYVKNEVYLTPPNNIDELKDRISEAIANISNDVKLNVVRSVTRRCELCTEKNGQHFEQYL